MISKNHDNAVAESEMLAAESIWNVDQARPQSAYSIVILFPIAIWLADYSIPTPRLLSVLSTSLRGRFFLLVCFLKAPVIEVGPLYYEALCVGQPLLEL